MIITFGHAHIILARKILNFVHYALIETLNLCIFQAWLDNFQCFF